MVDTGTYNKLSSNEQNEFNKYSSRFIRAVKESDAIDGLDFVRKYQVQGNENNWFIAKRRSNKPFANITTKSKAAIEALLTDAAQNYGR